jgi:hypothetical protein
VELLLDGRCGGFGATGGRGAAELVSAAVRKENKAADDDDDDEEEGPVEAEAALIDAARE